MREAVSLARTQPTRAGEVVGQRVVAGGDVLCSLHLSVQRVQEVLVGFASPTQRVPDPDLASYWHGFSGGESADLSQARSMRLIAFAAACHAFA